MKKLSKLLNIDHTDIVYEDPEFNSFIEVNSIEAKQRNSEIVKCPHCGEEGNRPNMMRWHFENCKTVLKNCEQCGNAIPKKGIVNHLYQKKKYCNRKCYMESKKGKPFLEMTPEIIEKLRIAAKRDAVNRSIRMKNNKVWEKSPRHVHAKSDNIKSK